MTSKSKVLGNKLFSKMFPNIQLRMFENIYFDFINEMDINTKKFKLKF